MRFSRPLALLPITWVAIASGCSTRSSDAATAAASTQMPITTASPDARELYVKGRGLAELLRTHDAHVVLQQAASKDSTFAMAEYNLALTSPTAKEFFAHLNKAVALVNSVSNGERLTILSLQAGANADPIKAQAYADSVVARFPQDERARFVLGNRYFAQQQYELAAGEYQQAVAINPNFSPAYNSLGYAYRAMGRKTDAEPVFKKYIDLVPNDPNPHDSYAELLMSMGRFDESIMEYGKALGIDPHFTGSYVGIAANQLFKGHHEVAIAETEKLYDSARDQNDRRVALFNQALAYVDERQMDKAVQRADSERVLDEAIGDTLNMSVDEQTTGNIQLAAGQVAAARRRYAHALALVVNSSLTTDIKDNATLADHFNQARVALALNDVATAHREAAAYLSGTEARSIDFQIKQAHELNGLIALAERHYDAALTELAKANQQNPAVLYDIALAYKGKGDATNAKSYAGQAADMHILPTLPYVLVRSKAQKMGA